MRILVEVERGRALPEELPELPLPLLLPEEPVVDEVCELVPDPVAVEGGAVVGELELPAATNGFAELPPVPDCRFSCMVPCSLCSDRLASKLFDPIAWPLRYAHIQFDAELVKSIEPPLHVLQFEP